MRRRFYPISIVLVAILVLLVQASAAPTPARPSTKALLHRQGNGNPPTQPFSMQTVQTTQTEAGPVTETCTITFTPVTGGNGESLVQVVRSCTVTAGAPPPPGSTPSSPPPASTSTLPPQTSTSSPPATTDISTSTSSTPSSVQSSPTDTSSTSSSSDPNSKPTPAPAITPVISSIPLPSITSPSSSPASSPSPTPTSTPGTAVPASSPTTQSSPPAGTGTGSPDTAPTPAATAQGAFQIPGKKISVLPIGLGIFAGISVIALIVVGLVTYERTKYRKIFRQRKLAEQGSGPGYGGTGS